MPPRWAWTPFTQRSYRRTRPPLSVRKRKRDTPLSWWGDGVNDSPALSEADAGIAISTGAAIAREIADITVSSEDLFALVTLRRLGEALMERIHGSYRFIVGFNLTLIALGVAGVLPPTTSALLHNGSTLGISLRNMTDLLNDEENPRK